MFRILIIDDEPDVRDLYRSMLEDQGYDIVEAENGQEALALARKQAFDLFVTDIMMPKMTGLDFIGRLRNIDPNAYVVIITGFDDISYNRKAIECGAWRYLVKPVGRNDLVEIAKVGVRERASLPYPQGLVRPAPVEKPAPQPQPQEATEPEETPPEEVPEQQEQSKKTLQRADTLGELFGEEARDLLKRLHEHENPESFEALRQDFEVHVERPFRALFAYVLRHLPEALTESLETGDGCIESVAKELPQGLMVNRYVSGALVMKDRYRDEAGQLFIAVNHKVLQYGFTIGDFGDDSQLRFISHVREHIDDLRPLVQMLAESMSFGPMLVRLFELEAESKDLITTQGDNLASLHVVADIPLQENLDEQLSSLRRRILRDFANLYPLILLAEVDQPMTSIREYLGLPPETTELVRPAEETSEPRRTTMQEEQPNPAPAARPEPPRRAPAESVSSSSARQTAAYAEAYEPPIFGRALSLEVDVCWIRALQRKKRVLIRGAARQARKAAYDLAQALVGMGEDGFVETLPLHNGVTAQDLTARQTENGVVLGVAPLVCEAAAQRSGPCVLVLEGVDRVKDAVAIDELLTLLAVRWPALIARGAVRFRMPGNLYVIAVCERTDDLHEGFRGEFAWLEAEGALSHLIDALPDGVVERLFPLLEELHGVAPLFDLDVFYTGDLERDIADIWRCEVEPALALHLDEETFAKYRWETVAPRLNSEPVKEPHKQA